MTPVVAAARGHLLSHFLASFEAQMYGKCQPVLCGEDINSSFCQHAVRQGTVTGASLMLGQLQGTCGFTAVIPRAGVAMHLSCLQTWRTLGRA